MDILSTECEKSINKYFSLMLAFLKHILRRSKVLSRSANANEESMIAQLTCLFCYFVG